MIRRFAPLIVKAGRGFASAAAVQTQPIGTKIRAAVSTGPKLPFVIEDLVLDEPRGGEVLIKVTACGICHTDLVCCVLLNSLLPFVCNIHHHIGIGYA